MFSARVGCSGNFEQACCHCEVATSCLATTLTFSLTLNKADADTMLVDCIALWREFAVDDPFPTSKIVTLLGSSIVMLSSA